MKKLFKRFKWLGILFGVLLALAGIFVAVYGVMNQGSLALVLSVVIAVICFIVGAITISIGIVGKAPLASFFDETFIYGAFIIAFGVTLLINQNIVNDIMVYTFSVAVLVIGVIYFIRAILAIANKLKVGVIILNFLIATILITAGILILCFQSAALSVIYVSFGVVLTIIGIITIIVAARK